jgi:adenylate kinase family enzyme
MRVAVVGVCGSGKTTIATELRNRGYDAYVVSQEHSIIRDLWRHRDPDAVVFLDARLETIRARRGREWPSWIYELQQERLADARAHATVTVATDDVSVDQVISRITEALPGAR